MTVPVVFTLRTSLGPSGALKLTEAETKVVLSLSIIWTSRRSRTAPSPSLYSAVLKFRFKTGGSFTYSNTMVVMAVTSSCWGSETVNLICRELPWGSSARLL